MGCIVWSGEGEVRLGNGRPEGKDRSKSCRKVQVSTKTPDP